MNRSQMISDLHARKTWDICIVGGGATGLGIAIDAASRGYSTVLIEQYDFAKGTSSRSTKLVHGGVRYLQQGNVKLVMEALKERGLLRQNAPHLVKNQSFLLPNYKWWEGPFYGIGLKIYDWMAGNLGLGPSLFLSKEEALQHAPTLDQEGLRGGVLFHDGQFDDARLAINMAQTAAEQNAVLLNYVKAEKFIKVNGRINGIEAVDQLNGDEYTIHAGTVINATGIFTDQLRRTDDPGKAPVLSLSQGTHLVVDKSFLPGDTAILVPETSDGRVLFAVPWHQQLIIGTTDVPVDSPSAEPIPKNEEISFILENIRRYLAEDPTTNDVKSVFSGLRPLVKGNATSTAALSRDHYIEVSETGLISITGGKWTTYRKMAEDVLKVAIQHNKIPDRECITENLLIHGAMPVSDYLNPGYYYGTDLEKIREIEKNEPLLSEKIHPDLPYTRATIVWAAREEMCMTVEDALSRRTRSLLLDARAAMEAAPLVASLLANENGYPQQWEQQQISAFLSLAANYLPFPLKTKHIEMMHPYLAEFIGTTILIAFGNGVVANVVLQKTKGHNSGWIVIAMGWAMAAFVGVYTVSKFSGAHLNPAVSICLAITGKFDWSEVPYYIAAQIAGAFAGSLLVWLNYRKHFDATEDANAKLAVFSTSPAISHPFYNLLTETLATGIFLFSVLLIISPTNSLGALDALPVALLVLAIGLSMGGPTGYAINPARDLGPRLAHAILPIRQKGSSNWSYAWIPVAGPILGAIIAALIYRSLQ